MDDTAISPLSATREAGLQRLQQFIPHAGRAYTDWRNHDFGPGGDNRVSGLSPWLRHRLIREDEVLDAALARHGLEGAEKFIQEVCWRTYWKGFLERRPVHWHDYGAACLEARQQVARDKRLARDLQQALDAGTGIDCFDAWVEELIATGYLHNHARMWFASIWVFTLQLPWALGADFFLRQLLDGDPASNTLSWRWVAGLHTPGKTYLARPSNIERYTNGRFSPGQALSAEAPAPEGIERPPVGPSPLPVDWQLTPRTGLLITEDDLHPESLFGTPDWPLVVAIQSTDWRSADPVSDAVSRFAAAGLGDALARNGATPDRTPFTVDRGGKAGGLAEALAAAGVDRLLTPWAPTGPIADALNGLRPALAAQGVELQAVPRDWDVQHWPAATHGFFRFWKAAQPLIRDRQAASAS